MVVIKFKKDDFSFLKMAKEIEDTVSSISFMGTVGEKVIEITIASTPIANGDASNFEGAAAYIDLEKALEENVFVTCDGDSSRNILSFLYNSFCNESEATIRFAPSRETVTITCDDISLIQKAKFQSRKVRPDSLIPTSNSLEQSPILSFKKDEWKSNISRFHGLSMSMEWLNKKAAGLNLVISDNEAFAILGTKSLIVKQEVNVLFHKESSNVFVHDKGVLLLTDEIIKTVEENTADDEIIKLFFGSPSDFDGEEASVSVMFGIGKRLIMFYSTNARKKVLTGAEYVQIDGLLSADPSKTALVDLGKMKTFFKAMDNNPLFVNEAVLLSFNKDKKELTMKNSDTDTQLFSLDIGKCQISENFSFEMNFFVLSSAIKKLEGESVTFKEKEINKKRIFVGDGSLEFVIGKVLKQ